MIRNDCWLAVLKPHDGKTQRWSAVLLKHTADAQVNTICQRSRRKFWKYHSSYTPCTQTAVRVIVRTGLKTASNVSNGESERKESLRMTNDTKICNGHSLHPRRTRKPTPGKTGNCGINKLCRFPNGKIGVVYQIECLTCPTTYIDENSRSPSVGISEHLTGRAWFSMRKT